LGTMEGHRRVKKFGGKGEKRGEISATVQRCGGGYRVKRRVVGLLDVFFLGMRLFLGDTRECWFYSQKPRVSQVRREQKRSKGRSDSTQITVINGRDRERAI